MDCGHSLTDCLVIVSFSCVSAYFWRKWTYYNMKHKLVVKKRWKEFEGSPKFIDTLKTKVNLQKLISFSSWEPPLIYPKTLVTFCAKMFLLPSSFFAVFLCCLIILETMGSSFPWLFQGGSYGKDTCLRGHSDLDLVIFVEGFPSVANVRGLISYLFTVLRGIKQHLLNSALATRILMTGITQHSLRFQYKCCNNDHIHHVDLMPCHDFLRATPTLGERLEFLRSQQILLWY